MASINDGQIAWHAESFGTAALLQNVFTVTVHTQSFSMPVTAKRFTCIGSHLPTMSCKGTFPAAFSFKENDTLESPVLPKAT